MGLPARWATACNAARTGVVFQDTNYVLGTAFTVEMVASGGHIKIYYNGAQKVDYPTKSSGNYFKAGCYLQSSTSKGDAAHAYAQVVIYGLWVTHA